MTFSFIIAIILQIIVMFMYVLAVSFILWMAVDAAKQDKYWWIVLVIGLPFVGAIIYFFVEKEGDYMRLPGFKKKDQTT